MDGGVFSVASKNFSTDALHRYDFTADDDPVQITGVTLEKTVKFCLRSSDRYTVNLADNPLIEDEAEAVLISLLDHLEGLPLPFTSSWIGNPAYRLATSLNIRTGQPRRKHTERLLHKRSMLTVGKAKFQRRVSAKHREVIKTTLEDYQRSSAR